MDSEIVEQVKRNPDHTGNKYHRRVRGLAAYYESPEAAESVVIDVYSFLTAFDVRIPGLQHAIKKLACAGIRGKASTLQDLREARDALDRAIEDVQYGADV